MKTLIERFRTMGKEQVIQELSNIKLEPEIKNCIIRYLFPKPLMDYELPERIKADKKPNIMARIVEAYRTEQYSRFIRHLFHCFCPSLNLDECKDNIFRLDYNVDGAKCPICGKLLIGEEELDKEVNGGEPESYVGFGANYTELYLDPDCLYELYKARCFLEEVEPGFLDIAKKFN